MKKLLLLLFSALCFAQSATISLVNTTTAPSAGYAPGAVISINIVKSGNLPRSAIQFVQSMVGVATYSAGYRPRARVFQVDQLRGTQRPPQPAPYSAQSDADPRRPDSGHNQVTLANNVTIPTVTFGLYNTAIESDPSGASLAVSVANPTSLPLPVQKSRCDVDGDGKIGQSDLTSVIAQITARTTSPATDLNSDGKTNVQDAQIVATAASGGVCNSK